MLGTIIIRFPDGAREYRYRARDVLEGDVSWHDGRQWKVLGVISNDGRPQAASVELDSDDLMNKLRSESGAIALGPLREERLAAFRRVCADLYGDCHAEECRRNRARTFLRALVLRLEEGNELAVEIRGAPVLCCGVVRIHRRPVVGAELAEDLGRRHRKAEMPRVAKERDLLGGDACRFEALGDLALDSPGHWADETFGRRR